MDLSIIVPNYRKEDLIPLQLRLIHKQWMESPREMKIEVIIVDHHSFPEPKDGEENPLYELLYAYYVYFHELNISLYDVGENNTFNYNSPFNVGAKRAQGEFMMFLPSDCMPLSPFHKHLEYHNTAGDILLKTGLINLPSFANWILKYDYDFKKYIQPCPSVAGGSVCTKHYHTIRGLSEYQTGTYTHTGLVPALVEFTPITLVAATDLLTIHFDRELHPNAIPPYDPVKNQKLRKKYSEEEKHLTLEQRNPHGWGNPPKLTRLI